MNKKILINKITELVDLKKYEVSRIIDLFIEEIENELSKGNGVSLVGFGSFSPRFKNARKGISPKTHEIIDIPASVHIGFKMGYRLKGEIRKSKELNKAKQEGQDIWQKSKENL